VWSLRRALFGIMIALLFFSILVSTFNFHIAEVKAPTGYPVHNLDTDLNYTTIQEAIDAPETLYGHTIFVEEGLYYEHVVANKSISLIGENRSSTIIDGNYTGDSLRITADNSRISNFTIQHGSSYGIYIYGENRCDVSFNEIKNNSNGICLHNSNASAVSNNKIYNNTGNGIYILYSSRNNASDNEIMENSNHGLSVFRSQNTTILNNAVYSNKRDGIYLSLSDGSTLLNNNMTANTHNFALDGDEASNYKYNKIDTTNIVDGKPIYYLNEISDAIFNAEANGGVFYLVDCDNITIRDSTLMNNFVGIRLWNTTNSRIENVTTMKMSSGISLRYSSNNVVLGNTVIEATGSGIHLSDASDFNKLISNKISYSYWGLFFLESFNNTVFDNYVFSNTNGVGFRRNSSDNIIFHNNFVENVLQVDTGYGFKNTTNSWDNDAEGNYWSNYTGVDLDLDGIGDTEHVIDANNIDNYPLMGMFHSFHTVLGYDVNVISNSTILNFLLSIQIDLQTPGFTVTSIRFYVTGEAGMGFFRILIPTALMNITYKVFVNGTEVSYTLLPLSNNTHSYLYFTYNHLTQEIIIIPEFPSLIILPLFMIATLLAAIIYKRKHTV